MTDIFVSYARGDRDRIEPLVRVLADRGWSIFWDRQIPAGQTWRSHIGAALNDARCVIVAWSSESVASEWVSEEADDAKQRGVLVPVLLDKVAPPIGFRSIQAADLSGWEPGRDSPLFDQLLRDIEVVLGAEHPRPERRDEAAAPAPRRHFNLPLAGISIAFVGALVIFLSFLVLRSAPSPDGPSEARMSAARVEMELMGTPQILELGGPEPQPTAPVSVPATSKYWLKFGELTCESVSGFWKKCIDLSLIHI